MLNPKQLNDIFIELNDVGTRIDSAKNALLREYEARGEREMETLELATAHLGVAMREIRDAMIDVDQLQLLRESANIDVIV